MHHNDEVTHKTVIFGMPFFFFLIICMIHFCYIDDNATFNLVYTSFKNYLEQQNLN